MLILRRLAFGLGVALSGIALLGLLAHFSPVSDQVIVILASGSPWLMGAAPLGLIVFALTRRWWSTGVAGLLLLVATATQLPLWIGSSPPARAPTVTVLTGNLRLGQASAVAVVGLVRARAVDVLMLQELTPAELNALQAAGLGAQLPYGITDPRPTAQGVGLWSRWPLTDEQRHGGFGFALVTARLAVPGTSDIATLVSTHMRAPWPQHDGGWTADLSALHRLLLAQPPGPILVGGDFNATWDNRQFRALLNHGVRDAAEQAGAGWVHTYPADEFFPPLIGIDHVLTRAATATRVGTVRLPGSDHRGLLVRVSVG